MADAIKSHPGKSHIGGFTLIEVMIVLALIAIVSAIAIPAWQSMIRNSNLKSAAHEIMASIQWAKSEAAKRNTCIGIQFNRPAPNTCSAGQGDCYEMFADDNCNRDVDAGEQILRTGGLGAKARINVPVDFAGGIAITPRGLLRTGGLPSGNVSLRSVSGGDLCYSLAISASVGLRLNPGRWNGANCP